VPSPPGRRGRGMNARPRTTGNRTSRDTGTGSCRPTARPASTSRTVAMSTNRIGVEISGQQLDAVDDARTGPAEVGRPIEARRRGRGRTAARSS
jgi:hypothetical protein